jgi:hypothetical protein
VTRHHSCRVSPFGHPRINARLTAPRGITQPPTSFIGSQCQGIHHAPLNTYNTKQLKILGRIKNCIINATNHHNPKRAAAFTARCSQPLSTNQTPHPTTKAGRQPPHPDQLGDPQHGRSQRFRFPQQQDKEATGLLSQSPIVCLMIHHRKSGPKTESRCGSTFVVHRPDTHYRARHCLPTALIPQT